MKNKFYTLMWKLLRPFVLLLHPLDVQGRENLPDEPVLICANHSSGWDPRAAGVCAGQRFPAADHGEGANEFKILPLSAAYPHGRLSRRPGNSDIGASKPLSKPEGRLPACRSSRRATAKEGQASVTWGGAPAIAIRAGAWKMLPVFIGTTTAVPEDPLCDRQALYSRCILSVRAQRRSTRRTLRRSCVRSIGLGGVQ